MSLTSSIIAGAWKNSPKKSPPSLTGWTATTANRSPSRSTSSQRDPCDNRFYGVVIREHSQNRTTAPEAVEMLGQNLSPARLKMRSSTLSNLLNIKAEGVKKLDVWLSPKLIDFKRKLEIRINSDKAFFKGQVKLSLEPLLEDLRLRGDRQQIYWYKIAAG